MLLELPVVAFLAQTLPCLARMRTLVCAHSCRAKWGAQIVRACARSSVHTQTASALDSTGSQHHPMTPGHATRSIAQILRLLALMMHSSGASRQTLQLS